MYSIFDVTVHESSQLSETDMIKTAERAEREKRKREKEPRERPISRS